jgi:hypothetical protein
MKEPRILADILKDYFQNGNEPLAVEFRKHFAGTGNPTLTETELHACPLINETTLEDWVDNQDVMHTLHISPRTLQTLRSNGILPFSRIGNKLYYRKQDILKILTDNYIMHKIRNYERDK